VKPKFGWLYQNHHSCVGFDTDRSYRRKLRRFADNEFTSHQYGEVLKLPHSESRWFKLGCMTRQPGTYAIFETSEGNITCRLFEKDAPKTVQNFIDLAEGKRDWKDHVSGKKGPGPLYSGTIFHRVIPDFMIQGGDPSGTGMGGPGYKFEDETKGSPHKFDRSGKLAMANAGPNTNGSQFFITVAPTTWLTGKHTIFGEVVEGQDVVDKITSAKRNSQDRPLKDIKLNNVKIERA
jgi:peptidyl-prolyl cis-trans isomerase A (cyclophilin A)